MQCESLLHVIHSQSVGQSQMSKGLQEEAAATLVSGDANSWHADNPITGILSERRDCAG
jgi:hypothetical protein